MTPLRFIHLGDLHLAATHPRNADRLAALDQAIASARQEPIAAWLFPGDLFHAKSGVQDRNDLANRLIVMADVAPVVIVPGNHDAPGDLDIFAALKARYQIHVVTSPQVLNLLLADRTRAAVFCLPYPRKAALVAAGLEHEALHQAVQNAMDLIFMDAAGKLEAAQAQDRPTLMIGHVSVAGAVSSVGQPQIGGELEITQAHLDRLQDTPKLLNHVHKHQTVGRAVYAGSLCRLDWGECEDKGYGVATMSDFVWTYRFVKLDIPPMYHVEGDWTPADVPGAVVTRWPGGHLAADRFAWTIRRGPGGAVIPELPTTMDEDGAEHTDWRGCDVRARMRYPQAEQARLAERTQRIRDLFCGARRLEVEPIAVASHQLRAPEVVEARTLDEKLQAWARLTGVAWTEDIVRCATALQVLEPDAVMAEVERRLAPLADLTELMAESQTEAARLDTAFAELMAFQPEPD